MLLKPFITYTMINGTESLSFDHALLCETLTLILFCFLIVFLLCVDTLCFVDNFKL